MHTLQDNDTAYNKAALKSQLTAKGAHGYDHSSLRAGGFILFL